MGPKKNSRTGGADSSTSDAGAAESGAFAIRPPMQASTRVSSVMFKGLDLSAREVHGGQIN